MMAELGEIRAKLEIFEDGVAKVSEDLAQLKENTKKTMLTLERAKQELGTQLGGGSDALRNCDAKEASQIRRSL